MLFRSLLLGVMLALALQTEFRLRPVVGRFGTRVGVAVGLKESNDRLQQEVVTLRKQVTEFEQQIGHRSTADAVLAAELREVKLRAGLLPVTGPGLILTLRDSPLRPKDGPSEQDAHSLTEQLIVHDRDINMILGELKSAGAEALGISGADVRKIQRVTYRTSARCTGPGMDINDTRIGAPFHIFAIGDPKELRAQLEMRDGVIKALQLDTLQMITIQESPKILIPEYSGSFTFKYAQPADSAR